MKYKPPSEDLLKHKLAANLRLLRLSHNPEMSQARLADELMISQQSLSNYESGICLPPTYVMAAMADFFGLTIDQLLQ